MCSDDTHVIYADGKQVASSSYSDQVTTVTLPPTTRLLAVSVTNIGSNGGWRGVIGNNESFTDSSWKCTNIFVNGWQKLDFDDSGWPNALQKLYTTASGGCATLPQDAKWLWVESYYTSVNTIYCRKVISKLLLLLFHTF